MPIQVLNIAGIFSWDCSFKFTTLSAQMSPPDTEMGAEMKNLRLVFNLLLGFSKISVYNPTMQEMRMDPWGRMYYSVLKDE